MFSLSMAIDLVTPGSWMGSVDLKQAYYSVPIAVLHCRVMRFRWKDTLYEFTCLPNDLAACPRISTIKPIYAALSVKGFVTFSYIDDSFVFADSVIKLVGKITWRTVL
jgi:hypothetical protein